MTSSSAAPEAGGTSSVLLVWSVLIIFIGVALFTYSVVVTLRGRRRRERANRRRPAPVHAPGHASGHTPGQALRPLPPPPASRPLPANLPATMPPMLPSGPTVGGMPVDRQFGAPRTRALPAGPTAGRGYGSAQPGAPGQRYPSAPPAALPAAGPHALPAGPSAGTWTGSPPALPAGPVVGTGYSGSGYGYRGAAPYPQPPGVPGQVSAPTGASPAALPAAGVTASPAVYGSPSDPGDGQSYPAAYSAAPATTAYTAPTELHPNVPASREESRREQPARRRGKSDECAALRSQCEQLREIAATAQTNATQAALDAETAHADFLTAQRAAEEARRAHDLVARESAEVAAEIAELERTSPSTATNDARHQLQAETSHAAFAAYRRGDISAEQLREVFKRAEGWTPEHDRLAQRSTELRAEEVQSARARDIAILAAEDASENARTAAITARTLDDQARTAAVDARGRCAAADACEARQRR